MSMTEYAKTRVLEIARENWSDRDVAWDNLEDEYYKLAEAMDRLTVASGAELKRYQKMKDQNTMLQREVELLRSMVMHSQTKYATFLGHQQHFISFDLPPSEAVPQTTLDQ